MCLLCCAVLCYERWAREKSGAPVSMGEKLIGGVVGGLVFFSVGAYYVMASTPTTASKGIFAVQVTACMLPGKVLTFVGFFFALQLCPDTIWGRSQIQRGPFPW